MSKINIRTKPSMGLPYSAAPDTKADNTFIAFFIATFEAKREALAKERLDAAAASR